MPQNCKNPTQRQRFITTIKNKTEKKNLKCLIRFHSANKIYNYNRRGNKRKKIQKNLQSKSKHNILIYYSINVFLESLLSESFPLLGVTVHFTSLGCPPCNTADLWPCCGGSSDSNLVLLLCVLASNVHSYQNQCVFFCGSSQ